MLADEEARDKADLGYLFTAAGLAERQRDPADRRLARIHLTPRGAAILRRLTHTHLDERARLAPAFEGLWDGLAPTKHLPPERRVGAD